MPRSPPIEGTGATSLAPKKSTPGQPLHAEPQWKAGRAEWGDNGRRLEGVVILIENFN